MNDPFRKLVQAPLPDVARRLDDICNRFEAAWRSGSPPRIEDFLDGWPQPERPSLLRELVLLDEHYRRGQNLPRDDYTRFPDFDLDWLREVSAIETPVPTTSEADGQPTRPRLLPRSNPRC